MNQSPWQKSDIFERIAKSKFRSKFKLRDKDIAYVTEKGMEVIESHARDFVDKRLAPAEILNDGKQTPMKGHPVFIAQHATACCCRGCLYKWHGIEEGTELSQEEKDYVIDILMEFIKRQVRS